MHVLKKNKQLSSQQQQAANSASNNSPNNNNSQGVVGSLAGSTSSKGGDVAHHGDSNGVSGSNADTVVYNAKISAMAENQPHKRQAQSPPFKSVQEQTATALSPSQTQNTRHWITF